MVLKASTWVVLGPTLWIAIVLLVASGKADGAIETIDGARGAETVQEETSAPSTLTRLTRAAVQSGSTGSSRISVGRSRES